MPNWKIHIEVGKRVNNSLKFEGEDLNLFLLGNILPDFNNRYVVKDISNEIAHRKTHFEYSYSSFYNKYKEKIDNLNPLFCGYLLHLYTDYTWNVNYANKLKDKGINNGYTDELRIMKQHDFRIFNNNFIQNFININNEEKAVDEIKKIDEVSINKQDIENVEEYLKNQNKYDGVYRFYTAEQLSDLMDETIKKAINKIEEKNK